MENEVVQLIERETKVAPKSKEVVDIPIGYIPVTFCTKGKLSAPEVLHFRNYTLEEATELSAIREDNYLQRLVVVLNTMVLEKFDCRNLHIEEMKEVMLNIHLNFWGPMLKEFPYEYDLDGEKKIGHADVVLKNIKVDNLAAKFKEPVTICDQIGNTIKFRLPRVTDNLDVQVYQDNLLKEEEAKFAGAKLFIEQHRGDKNLDLSTAANPEIIYDYLMFLDRKDRQYNQTHRLIRLISFNDVEPVSLEEKLEYANKIDMSVWTSMREVVQDFSFGVNPEVKVFDEATESKIIRRFQFRTLDFIPNMAAQHNSRNVISFGN